LLPNKTIKTGPVFGVLIAGKEKPGAPPIPRRTLIYRELSRTAVKKGLFLYYFYAEEVDWEHQWVKGFLYDERSKRNTPWLKAKFRLPDIVYNRISYRHKEDAYGVQAFMNKAARAGIHVFNSRFLNKWEVHQCLEADSRTKEFILPTACFSKPMLTVFLNNYPEFFIKPVANSIGKGIIKVIISESGQISYFRSGKSSRWQECQSREELYHRLSLPQGERYILQKGIQLASIDHRIFDIRAQAQKDGEGLWQFTGAAVRVAAAGKFLTHVPNGGSKRDYDQTIQEVFGQSDSVKEKLDWQLKTICRRVPLVLEEYLGINLAVLSMDIGIDHDGHMWIIEANSKPASFDEYDIRQRHMDLLTDYFLFKAWRGNK
jgi:hypothetical protein